MKNYTLRGGKIVLPHSIVDADIIVHGSKIHDIVPHKSRDYGAILDCTGLHILPGVIDTQVHLREPGLEHKEDLHTGSKAALKGGVTSVFEMPNTNPTTTSIDMFQDKLERAKKMYTNHAFYVGATGDNTLILKELESHIGCAGTKIFMGSSTGSLLVSDDTALEEILQNGGKRRVAIHAEDEDRLKERKYIAEQGGHPLFHPEWRDVESALRATKRIVSLARKTNRLIHILHISTADEMEFLKDHKDLVTIEVLVNHLTLYAPECYEKLGTYAQMNPPIRDINHQMALWNAVKTGIVDVLATDHAPHLREEKDKPYPQSPSGLTGVQTMLPIMLNFVHQGILTLQHLVELVCSAPQRIFGIQNKGRIAVGYDADFTFVDLNKTKTITHDWIESKCGWTPFDGMQVTGFPVGAMINGNLALWEEEIVTTPKGQPIKFIGQ